jgi:tRNA (guanine-N7-)-methyltransferase
MNSKSPSAKLPQALPEHRLASFGRRKGRKLRTGKQSLMDGVLPQISIEIPPEGMIDLPAIFPEQKAVWLEIGFGGGEHLAHQAALYPGVGIIGCEPYINGIGDLLKKISEPQHFNIRIFPNDARLLIEKLPDASLDKVFILYPDPWPKSRHHKRRLVSKPFLDELARVMKPGAQLRLATDHVDYCAWMLEQLLPHPDFTWTARNCDDWLKPWADWIPTKYEQKALAGRPTYLTFTRP